eukprot:jgi/Pico_ML_1/52265/g2995.t1
MVLFDAKSDLDLELMKENEELASMIQSIEEDKEYSVDARIMERELQSITPAEMLQRRYTSKAFLKPVTKKWPMPS